MKNVVWRDDVGSVFTASLRTFDVSAISDTKTTLSGLSELRIENELTLAISTKTRRLGVGTRRVERFVKRGIMQGVMKGRVDLGRIS